MKMEKCPKAKLRIGMPEGIAYFCIENENECDFECFIKKVWDGCALIVSATRK